MNADWACYARVSGVEQASNNSIPTQLASCQQRARDLGATQILDFVDAGVPGDLAWADRPALNRLLDLVEQGAVKGVVIYDPDRLARDLGVQLAVTEIIIGKGIQLEFCTQQLDASPEGMLFYQLRGAISQFERAKIRERTNRGRKKTLRDGRPCNKPRPYGLEYNSAQNSWQIVEEQAKVVRQIFAWAQDGIGPSAIAGRLNDLGIVPPRGVRSKRWWANTVMRMLANTTYVGRLYLNRYNQEGQRKNRFLPRERRVKATQRAEAEWIEVKVPAILEEELWQGVQELRKQGRRRMSGRSSPHYVYLASRLLRCGLCGSTMTGNATSRNGKRTYYYRCNGRYGEQKGPCQMQHIRADLLDQALWTELRTWLAAPERFAEIVRLAAVHDSATLVPEPNHQVDEVRADIARLQRLVATGAVREYEVRAVIRSLQDKEAALLAGQQRLAEAGAITASSVTPGVLEHLGDDARRDLLQGVVEAVIMHPDGRLELSPRRRLAGAP